MMISLRRCHRFPLRWLRKAQHVRPFGEVLLMGRHHHHVASILVNNIIHPSSAAAQICSPKSLMPPFHLAFYLASMFKGRMMSSSSFDSVGVAITCGTFQQQRTVTRRCCTFEQHQHNNSKSTLLSLSCIQSRGLSQRSRRGTRGPDMRNCKTIEELAQMAYTHLDVMSPRDMSAFWTLAAKFLRGRNQRWHVRDEILFSHQLDTLLAHTLDEIRSYGYRHLAQTTLGFAKIVKSVQGKRLPRQSPQQSLQNILIGSNAETKQSIFGCMAKASIPILSEFDARSLSNLIYAFGLAEYNFKSEKGRTLFDALGLISNIKGFEPQGLSNMLWAYANVKASNPNLFKKVSDHIFSLDNLGTFKPQELSNIVWAYVTAGESHPKLFKKVSDHIVALDTLRTFKPQELANIVWAFATTDESHPKLFKEVADHIVALDNLRTFVPQDLANIAWAYATAGESHPQLFKKVSDHIVALDSLRTFTPQELANIAWAYATANESHPQLFRKLSDHIVALDNLRTFKPQELANIVWGYTHANESPPHLFKKVSDHIVALGHLDTFDPQALANISWAYATAEESNPHFFRKLSDHIGALDNLTSFAPQALSNVLWAYATARESNPNLFTKVSNHIVALDSLRPFDPHALANILWAYATAEESNPQLFRRLSEHIIALDDLRTFKPHDLSNIAWAYAKAKESNPRLFQKVAEAAITKQNEFNSQGIANFLWAYSTHGQIDQQLFQSLAPFAATLLSTSNSQYNSQELANIAWSYAVANIPAPSLFNTDFINACLEKERDFPVEDLSQLHQWNLWQEELESNICLPASLQEKCYDAFVSQGFHQSAFQDNVISVLSSIGLAPEEEVLTKRGYRLDGLVEVNGSKVGIEVDGPSHFVGRKPTGSTILKHRQVVRLEGISIVSVPYWEWDKLWKDNGKKQKYLRALLGLS